MHLRALKLGKELELEPELEPDLVHVLVLQAQCSRYNLEPCIYRCLILCMINLFTNKELSNYTIQYCVYKD